MRVADIGLRQHGPDSMDPLPVRGQLAQAQPQGLRGQAFHAHPGKQQEASLPLQRSVGPVGPEGTGNDAGTYTHTEIALAPADDVRYCLTPIGMDDVAGEGSACVAAPFASQGVEGPLGVIGEFRLRTVEAGGFTLRGEAFQGTGAFRWERPRLRADAAGGRPVDRSPDGGWKPLRPSLNLVPQREVAE